MKVLGLFVTTCYATTVSNTVCNGKDLMTFTIGANTGESFTKFQTLGCSNQDLELTTSDYTKTGDNYNFSFNPYTTCIVTPNPNSPATYSVDFKVIASNEDVIDGQTVIFTGDQINLKCSFLDSYQVQSDLGAISLTGEEITGTEFLLAFAIKRTDSDYTTEITTEIETNQPVYHVLSSTTQSQLSSSDFNFKPYRIVLEKKNSALNFELFNTAMISCGHSQLGFEMDYDSNNNQWTFKYNQILVDNDLTAEYRILVDMQLCNSLATDIKCLAADTLCNAPPAQTYAVDIPGPVINNKNNRLPNDVELYESFVLSMDVKITDELGLGDWGDIIYLATDTTNWNERIPAIFIRRVSNAEIQLYFIYRCFDMSNRIDRFYEVAGWSVGESRNIKMQVRVDNGAAVVEVFVNDAEPTASTLYTSSSNGNIATCLTTNSGKMAEMWVGNNVHPSYPLELRNIRYGQLL